LHYKPYFKEKGIRIIEIPYFFAGSSDILYSHGKQNLWIGYDQRTSLKAAYYISELLQSNNLNITCLKLVNPKFYHLNLCFCPFGDRYALVYKDAFDIESFRLIKSIFGENFIIQLSNQEANNLIGNSLFINDISRKSNGYLIGNKFSNRLKTKISYLNIICIDLPLSEFIVGGGSVKSLVLDIS